MRLKIGEGGADTLAMMFGPYVMRLRIVDEHERLVHERDVVFGGQHATKDAVVFAIVDEEEGTPTGESLTVEWEDLDSDRVQLEVY